MPTLKRLLPEFKTTLNTNTWGAYATYYNYFCAWACEVLQKEAEPSDLTTAILRSYLNDRAASGVKPNTLNHEISALSTLCKWLHHHDNAYLPTLPTFRRPKPEPHHRTVPTDTEVYALLDACERFTDPNKCALASLIVRILIHTGARRTEMRTLTLNDFNLERRQIQIRRGKGNKARILPVCEELADAYRKYLVTRPAATTDALFIVGSTPVGSARITSLFEDLRAMSKQGHKRYLQPHGLRHWFACNTYRNMIEAGERDPMRKLQRLLGHTSIQTTERYLIGLGVDIADCAAYTGTARATVSKPEQTRRHRVVVNRKLRRRRF